MPIYQYACRSCGHSLEALRKISDEPLKVCPNCNEPELAKQLTAAAFKLKGTGWYETDFKNSGKKEDSGSDKKDSGSDKKKVSGDKSPDSKSGDSGDKAVKPSGGSKSSQSGASASGS